MSQLITKCTFDLKTRSKMHGSFVSKQHQQSGSALGQSRITLGGVLLLLSIKGKITER